MKKLITLLFVITAILIQAQTKQLVLTNFKTNESVQWQENIRIEVTLKNNFVYKGKFQIIDEQTIAINNFPIKLNDIAKIHKNSIFMQIVKPFLIVVGSVTVFVAIAASNMGGVSSSAGNSYVVAAIIGGSGAMFFGLINNN